MKQHLYLDSAFKINYGAEVPNLSQFPFKVIETKGLKGALNGPNLFYIVQKHLEKKCENVVELKPKVVNESSSKKKKVEAAKQGGGKKKRSKISVSQF